MISYRTLKFAALVGTVLTASILAGCGGKAEEPTAPSSAANPTASAPTSSQIPPEVKARMDKTQADMKARADAQGKAMTQGGMAPGAGK